MIPRKTLEVYSLTGAYNDGKYSELKGEAYYITASIQPLTGRQMQALPEGRRNKQALNLISSSLLNTLEEQNPDIVIIDNEQFEVFSREAWQNRIIDHYRYTVIKLDREENYNIISGTLQTAHNINGEIEPAGD